MDNWQLGWIEMDDAGKMSESDVVSTSHPPGHTYVNELTLNDPSIESAMICWWRHRSCCHCNDRSFERTQILMKTHYEFRWRVFRENKQKNSISRQSNIVKTRSKLRDYKNHEGCGWNWYLKYYVKCVKHTNTMGTCKYWHWKGRRKHGVQSRNGNLLYNAECHGVWTFLYE